MCGSILTENHKLAERDFLNRNSESCPLAGFLVPFTSISPRHHSQYERDVSVLGRLNVETPLSSLLSGVEIFS